MIDFVTVGTNNLKDAGVFYDAVFDVLRGKRSTEYEGLIMWPGKSGTGSTFLLIWPAEPEKQNRVILPGGSAAGRGIEFPARRVDLFVISSLLNAENIELPQAGSQKQFGEILAGGAVPGRGGREF